MFDGVHLGHQYVLKYLSDIAKKEEAETAVMTFNPHPRLVLQPFTEFELLKCFPSNSVLSFINFLL